MKRPGLWTVIEHHEPAFDRINWGIVVMQLSSQFVYGTPDGNTRMCMYSEAWNLVSARKNERQTTVDAPSVWSDHQSRTCIVLEVKGDVVKFIPMGVDNPYGVETYTVEDFCLRYLKPMEYPVSQAARLFVEYARNTGATDEALKALSQHTTITEEEKEMARQSAAKEKTAPKKAAAKKAPAKKAAPKKPSAAAVYREEIMAGKSFKQICAAVSKKCPDAKEPSEAYVRYYVNELEKKGEKPPWPKGLPEPKGRGRAKGD